MAGGTLPGHTGFSTHKLVLILEAICWHPSKFCFVVAECVMLRVRSSTCRLCAALKTFFASRRDARFSPSRPNRNGTVRNGIQSQHVALALPPEFITMSVVRLEDRHEHSEHEDGGRGERQSEPCT